MIEHSNQICCTTGKTLFGIVVDSGSGQRPRLRTDCGCNGDPAAAIAEVATAPKGWRRPAVRSPRRTTGQSESAPVFRRAARDDDGNPESHIGHEVDGGGDCGAPMNFCRRNDEPQRCGERRTEGGT